MTYLPDYPPNHLKEAGIASPRRYKKGPDFGPTAVMVSSRADLALLRGRFDFGEHEVFPLFNSRVYFSPQRSICLAGPVVGAPYAAIVMETLFMHGVTSILYVGWCGSVSEKLGLGDMLIPDLAFVDEGTSGAYLDTADQGARPHPEMQQTVVSETGTMGVSFQKGPVWTTDAIFRETPSKIRYFQQKGALAVEMEMSAVFTIAAYRKKAATGILTVSDRLDGQNWRPGFSDPQFQQGRNTACEAVWRICQNPNMTG